mmetsp:Transcript_148054/g.258764  ORF Transcript_148054/g.258764 Transcript_148054/m.258764 type:complete len:445 (+) Transcript_148054:213-1547(+)
MWGCRCACTRGAVCTLRGQGKATPGEARLVRVVDDGVGGAVAAGCHSLLGHAQLLFALQDMVLGLLLVELLLGFLQFTGQALDLILVLRHLRCRHVQLRGHPLHLPIPLPQVLMVNVQLLGHLRPRLTGEDVLQLHIQLLLLLDDHILLHALLRLRNQPLLQRLDLLDHLVLLRVGALQLPPAVDVHGVLQLLGQGLDLSTLLHELVLGPCDLLLQVLHVADLPLGDVQVALQLLDLQPQHADVHQPVTILDLPLVQGGLLDADLLVQQGQLVVAADELRAEDVPLVHHVVELLLLLGPLCVAVGDDLVELVDLLVQALDLALLGLFLAFQVLDLPLQGLHQLLRLLLREVLLHQGLLLGRDFLLQLVNLVVHDFELPLHLIDLIMGLDQVLRVQVPIRPHGLVQVLLLLQLGLTLADLLLQVGDGHGADLHLLQGGVVLGRCL